MANLNKVMLIGNLTRDPEVRYTPSGKAVADLGLAVNRVWKNDQGQKQEETTFIDVTLWGSTAELAAKYLSKGRSCYIEGRLKLDTWDDKETGKKRSKLGVVGDTLQFIGDGKGAQGGGSRPSSDRNSDDEQPRPRSQGGSPAPAQDFQEDDDIPF